MKKETVSLLGNDKPKGTIPTNNQTPCMSPKAAKEYVEKVRQDAAYRNGKAPAGVSVIAADASAVVMDPKNPHLSIFREFRAGLITFDEMQEAIDCQVCQPESLEEYRYKILPDKPVELHNAEQEIAMQCARMGEIKRREVMKDFQITVEEQFKAYFKAVDKIKEINMSNLYTLKEMLDRQRDKNPVFAARLQAAIDTH